MIGALLLLSTLVMFYTTSNAALQGYCGMGRSCVAGSRCCDPMSGFCCPTHLECCRKAHTMFCCSSSNVRIEDLKPNRTLSEQRPEWKSGQL